MIDVFYTTKPVPSEAFVARILQERYGIFAPKFTRNAHGKPSLCGAPPFFSLSHTGGRTFAAFSITGKSDVLPMIILTFGFIWC